MHQADDSGKVPASPGSNTSGALGFPLKAVIPDGLSVQDLEAIYNAFTGQRTDPDLGTIVNLPKGYKEYVKPIDFTIEGYSTSRIRDKCCCDIKELMTYGCKCNCKEMKHE